ncbi:MAG: hypothetical protein AAB250_13470, partial [Bdellovibrionota bacterium]|mgnify:CR=1
MRKGFGFILVIAALIVGAAVAAQVYNVEYWLLPSKQKFAQNWQNDVAALEKSGKLPESWQQIREIVVKTDNSPAQTWVVGLEAPIKKKQDGFFRLDVFVAHWIDDDRYGALIQYNLVDLRDGNTTWELSRNLQIGRIL